VVGMEVCVAFDGQDTRACRVRHAHNQVREEEADV